MELDYVGVIVGPDLVVRNGRVIARPEARSSMDRSIHTWRTLLKKDPNATRTRLDAIIKNTYRTLMTRGQKGCFVHFVDEETRSWFESRVRSESPNVIPFENALPLLGLRAVADGSYRALDGSFADETTFVWQRIRGGPYSKDKFLVRAEGNSMEPKIKNGDLCLFRQDSGGSRNGKIVLCRVGGFAGDAPVALIKRYQSARVRSAESIGEAKAIVLSSLNEEHEDIILSGGEHFSVFGVFERVVEECDVR